jgi:hypothetical protein
MLVSVCARAGLHRELQDAGEGQYKEWGFKTQGKKEGAG